MAEFPDSGSGADSQSGTIEVEVIYAEPHGHHLVALQLPAGSTLQQAVDASGLIGKFPDLDPTKYRLGIYGKIARADTLLRTQDRVEIYRPVDSREIRRQRAATDTPAKRARQRRRDAGRSDTPQA